MRQIFFLILMAMALPTEAQTNADYLKEINKDIWLPFVEAYGTLNAEKYKSLQSEDFIRAEGNQKSLPTYQNYFDNVTAWFKDVKTEGRKLSIAFRFTERFANEKIASERGIYELKTYDKNGIETWKGYGKFHVFTRKINGVWKIVVDYDSNENNTINEQTYLAAFGMDELEKY